MEKVLDSSGTCEHRVCEHRPVVLCYHSRGCVELMVWLTLSVAGEYGSDGEPKAAAASLPMKELIRGWSHGLQMMRYGGASRLIVPPALGYGSVQSGPVPPNSTLCFDIRLLGRTEAVRFVPSCPHAPTPAPSQSALTPQRSLYRP